PFGHEASSSTGAPAASGKSHTNCTPGATPLRDSAFEQAPRVAAVDVAEERRVHVVAKQLLQTFGERGDDVSRHTEHVVLLGPQPRRRVLEYHPEAGPVAVVGAAAVPEGAQVEHHRPGRHLGDGDRGALVGTAVGPGVASADE